MFITLLHWLYIFSVCSILGAGLLTLTEHLTGIHHRQKQEIPAERLFMAGTIGASLYAQVFSLFSKVGMIAQLLLLALCACIFYFVILHPSKNRSVSDVSYFYWIGDILPSQFRQNHFSQGSHDKKKIPPLWELFLYLCILLLICFFSTRGPEHTDTSAYHALSIRFIEEYGVLKGLGNLMGNFAYNSSWLPFAALFSLKFLSPLSLHGVNGLLAAVLSLYAMRNLLRFRKHEGHAADMLRIAILFYNIVVACVLQSPATDQPAMLFTLYILLRYAEETEASGAFSKENATFSASKTHTLALHSIAAVFTASIKLSAAPLAIICLAPIFLLAKNKQGKSNGH